jgi:hypothetical protein
VFENLSGAIQHPLPCHLSNLSSKFMTPHLGPQSPSFSRKTPIVPDAVSLTAPRVYEVTNIPPDSQATDTYNNLGSLSLPL